MKFYSNPERNRWEEILRRPVEEFRDMTTIIAPVFEAIRRRGDNALQEYTQKFDNVALATSAISEVELQEAGKLLPSSLKSAIELAAKNIHRFHSAQKSSMVKVETSPGVVCWQKSMPIEKVGLYVPGGSAPLFSTLLMLAIPANIAGCSEIVVCSPPQANGEIHPAVLYTACLTGVTKVFAAGGIQAIAAMAEGTETIPKVYKIFGPGNQYVTAAKQYAFSRGVAIDMPAGPSEVAVIADETANPLYVATDLLSQAEHGADSQVVLISKSERLIKEVQKAIGGLLETLPRKQLAEKALDNSIFVTLGGNNDIVEMTNNYAPEHLIIATSDADLLAEKISHAGSVFIGNYTPESAGDYASGTNHTLPTNGYARSFNGVNLDSFMRKVTFQKITREGLQTIGPAIMEMAAAEGLEAHRLAVEVRLKG